MSWCVAMCWQRINAMVLTPYDLFSWNKRNIILISTTLHVIILLQIPFWKMQPLCTLVLLHHAGLVLPSSSFPMLPPSLLGVDCLSSLLSGGPGPPSHLLPLSWPHFPQVPGIALLSCRAQLVQILHNESISIMQKQLIQDVKEVYIIKTHVA